jgi:hypothetical protein
MKKVQIKQLGEWVPMTGNGYNPKQDKFVDANIVILTNAVSIVNTTVKFEGQFEGKIYKYDFKVETAEIAQKIADVIKSKIGSPVLDLEELAIEIDK